MKKRYFFAFLLFSFQLGKSQVVINEVYGGGNNSGATYRNDFVELFNKSSTAVSIAGWKLEYFSSTGSSGGSITFTTGNTTIAGRSFFLVQLAGGTTNGMQLPAPDATNTGINMSATAGRVDLTNSGNTLVDRVGYGTSTSFEGTAAAPAATGAAANSSSVERTPTGTDTDNNSSDFKIKSPPTPNNSASPAALPIKVSNVRAVQKWGSVIISWTNFSETDVKEYLIERSADGFGFAVVGQANPKNNQQGQADYTHTDLSPAKGLNYYRIRSKGLDGKESFSNVLKLNIAGVVAALIVYPNPVKGGDAALQVSNLPAGRYTVRILGADGRVFSTNVIAFTEGTSIEPLLVNRLPAGLYTVQASGPVIIQQSFIKQ